MTKEEYKIIRKKIKKKTPKAYFLTPVAIFFSVIAITQGLLDIFFTRHNYDFLDSDLQDFLYQSLHERAWVTLIIGVVIFIICIIYLAFIDKIASPWKNLKSELDENWQTQSVEAFEKKVSDLKIAQS